MPVVFWLQIPKTMQFDHTSGKIVSIDDADLYYETKGNPSNPILLLLHGGGGTIEDFNPVVEYLSRYVYLIGLDSRGHGRSSAGSEPLTYERLQHDVEIFISQARIGKVCILGFSDGGIVGYRIAIEKKVKIEHLITIGGTWSHEDVTSQKDLFEGFTVDRWKELMPRTFEIYADYFPDLDMETHLEKIKKMWLDISDSGYPDNKVGQIKCQTLVVRGDQDHMFSRQSAVRLCESINDSIFYNMPFAGHGVIQEQKQAFLDVFCTFLRLRKK
ncbi:alpha/beta fold hydrolase [Flavobacterium silvaticum]|uniref:Alpha/beta hydrolase n=1 Tax=Flavobacterium silvaticum TaxID=1852020 RepID=A0A972FNE0_9FLAO|nr:alpha/beta hydrolase [Flavobacterium silvaticum]NMH28877.1 alpha/beta hydrolase [Flavobacterium silvaticum]